MLDYFEDKENIFICLEKHQGTTLDEYININADKIEENDIITYANNIG